MSRRPVVQCHPPGTDCCWPRPQNDVTAAVCQSVITVYVPEAEADYRQQLTSVYRLLGLPRLVCPLSATERFLLQPLSATY